MIVEGATSVVDNQHVDSARATGFHHTKALAIPPVAQISLLRMRDSMEPVTCWWDGTRSGKPYERNVPLVGFGCKRARMKEAWVKLRAWREPVGFQSIVCREYGSMRWLAACPTRALWRS